MAPTAEGTPVARASECSRRQHCPGTGGRWALVQPQPHVCPGTWGVRAPGGPGVTRGAGHAVVMGREGTSREVTRGKPVPLSRCPVPAQPWVEMPHFGERP